VQGLYQSRLSKADYALISSSFRYNTSLVDFRERSEEEEEEEEEKRG
jgi:hypothetical protein